MTSKKVRIGKRAVDAVQKPEEGEVRLWDDALAGFCLRAYSNGRKVYALKCRVGGRQRWITIGEHGKPWTDDNGVSGDLTAERARARAERMLGDAKRGIDPTAAKKAKSSLTVAQLIDLYLKDGPHTRPNKRASSWATDRSNLQRHVRPLIGDTRLDELSRADATKLLRDVAAGLTKADVNTKKQGRAIVTGGEGVSHRVLTSARAMLAWSIEHSAVTGFAGPNPFAGIRLPARPATERFLSTTEAASLFEAIAELEGEGEIAAKFGAIFRLLLLTGARRNEIAALRWSEVDLDRKLLVLPPARTKAGGKSGDRRIALNSVALQILKDQPRKAKAVYVFPADKGKSGHTTGAPKVWREKVRPKAKLAGLRLHDLRHSFASFALADGASLALIGKALGHASARSTERYAHVKDDPLRALSEGVAGRLGAKKDG
jgi:integrase